MPLAPYLRIKEGKEKSLPISTFGGITQSFDHMHQIVPIIATLVRGCKYNFYLLHIFVTHDNPQTRDRCNYSDNTQGFVQIHLQKSVPHLYDVGHFFTFYGQHRNGPVLASTGPLPAATAYRKPWHQKGSPLPVFWTPRHGPHQWHPPTQRW